MGIAGLSAYLFLLVQSFRTALKMFSDKVSDISFRSAGLAFIAVICGYIIYGLADFDDTAILLFVFTELAVLKTAYARGKDAGQLIPVKRVIRYKIPLLYSPPLRYFLYIIFSNPAKK